jgi:6,7-dimethyl-8-ribityllumazine synthase
MSAVIEGVLDASGRRFAVVVSRFNEMITRKLLEGAIDCLVRHNAAQEALTIAWVPGAFEIPVVAKKLAASHNFDAVICLGAVIRGDTPHFDFIASEVAKGVAQVSMTAAVPAIFGVITTDNLDQALERSGSKAGNKGWEAALSAIEMADLYGQLAAK